MGVDRPTLNCILESRWPTYVSFPYPMEVLCKSKLNTERISSSKLAYLNTHASRLKRNQIKIKLGRTLRNMIH